MKFNVTIEETVSQTFEIEAESMEEAYDSAITGYKNGTYVVAPGECTSRQLQVQNLENGECTEWDEF